MLLPTCEFKKVRRCHWCKTSLEIMQKLQLFGPLLGLFFMSAVLGLLRLEQQNFHESTN